MFQEGHCMEDRNLADVSEGKKSSSADPSSAFG